METTTHPWPHKAYERYLAKGGIFLTNVTQLSAEHHDWRIIPGLVSVVGITLVYKPKRGHLEGEPTRSLGDNNATMGNWTTEKFWDWSSKQTHTPNN